MSKSTDALVLKYHHVVKFTVKREANQFDNIRIFSLFESVRTFSKYVQHHIIFTIMS